MVTHPLLSVLPGRRLRVIVPLLLLAVAVTFAVFAGQSTLTSIVTPEGLWNLVLSGDPQTAHWILSTWEAAGAAPMAFFTAGIALLWLAALSTTLSFGCVWSAQQSPSGVWLRSGLVMAWAQWVGAILGAVSVVATLAILRGSLTWPWLLTARWCQILDSVIFGLGLLYAAAGAVVMVAAPLRRTLEYR
jgi:hypothetical protein